MPTTAEIACQQFVIDGAEETIFSAKKFGDVFSPPYHGPRNIPIVVNLEAGDNYVHFPIVRTGYYAIYFDTVFKPNSDTDADPDSVTLYYGGVNQNIDPSKEDITGTSISIKEAHLGGCQAFKSGCVSTGEVVFVNDDPQPIAVRLNVSKNMTVKYIVSLFES